MGTESNRPSKTVPPVYAICLAYESGFGHGLKNDGLRNPYLDGSAEHEAYDVGRLKGIEKHYSPPETYERLSNLVDRLKRINSLNDNPAHYIAEIDRLTACGKFIASDEYCERLIGHEGRCGLLPGTPPSAL